MPSSAAFNSLHVFPHFTGGPCPLSWPSGGAGGLAEFSLAAIMEVLWLGYEVNITAAMNWKRFYEDSPGVTYEWDSTASDSASYLLCETAPADRVCGVALENSDVTLDSGTCEYYYTGTGGPSLISTFTVPHEFELTIYAGPTKPVYEGSAAGSYRLPNLLDHTTRIGTGYTGVCGMHVGTAADFISGGGDSARVIGSSTASIFGDTIPVYFLDDSTSFTPGQYTYSLVSHALTVSLGEKWTI